MSGLVAAEGVFPYGYQGPWRQVAKQSTPSISPTLYDPKQLQTSWNKHVPVPRLGDRWPAPNEGDTWGNVIAKFHMPHGPSPEEYDKGRLELSSTLKVPVPMPRSRDALFAELAELTGAPAGAGPAAAPQDILEIGKLILTTTTDPVRKHFWESHINSLTKLRMIAMERPSGLNQEESALVKRISDAMKAEAINLTNPAHEQKYVPAPPPLTAQDLVLAIRAAGLGQQQLPVVIHAAQPQVKPQPGATITNPPLGTGPPQSGVYEYTYLPDEEWKTPGAAPGTAFYVANPKNDYDAMAANLLHKYDTGVQPIVIPDMANWRRILLLLNPTLAIKRAVGEDDVSLISRNIRLNSRGRVIAAYLARPYFFKGFIRGSDAEVQKKLNTLAASSVLYQFPLHPGMELKPSPSAISPHVP